MTTQLVPDSEYTGIMKLLPAKLRGFALLARFDRPIGWWLLFWPCVFGLALSGGLIARWDLALWMLLGAVAMRGAGCVYNDIIDRDLDAQVARTANRPLASGLISRKAAWAWLLMLALVGLTVLLQLNLNAQLLALGSLLLVAAYPFMKRITQSDLIEAAEAGPWLTDRSADAPLDPASRRSQFPPTPRERQ